MTNELNTLNVQGFTMKKVFMSIEPNFFSLLRHVKFILRDEKEELLIYGYGLIHEDYESIQNGFISEMDKIQLKELRKFIDQALEEIEKSEEVDNE